MPPGSIQHALGLHLHQPAGNLQSLLRQDEVEAGRILQCYGRIARHAHKYAHVARLHVALSVVLLEQLRDPELIDACRHLADLPAILEGLRSAASIEFVGSGYRHAPLPLVPPEDWEEQLRNERVTIEAVLGRVLKGYWPPAALFAPEMIPALVRAGYEYVLLPDSLLTASGGGGVDPYRPYRISHGGVAIVAVPLDGGFSRAQQVGLEAGWLADEVRNGVALSPPSEAPYLLSTWSDGENGEWFRRLDEEQGFFGQFFSPYMEFCETGEFPVRPVHLSEYLSSHRPAAEAGLRVPPATEVTSVGAEDEDQRLALARLFRSSARYWALARAATQPAHTRTALLQARELILAAEESSFLLGDASRRAAMLELLDRADRLLDPTPSVAERPSAVPTQPAAPVPAGPASKGSVPEMPKDLPTETARGVPPEPPGSRPAEGPERPPVPGAKAPSAEKRSEPRPQPPTQPVEKLKDVPGPVPKAASREEPERAPTEQPKGPSASTRKGAAKRRAGKRGHGRRS
jgi:hypothetical protein